MKREGRQHGMVRTHRILPSALNPRPNTRFITRFDSPPTAGLFAKVSSKPTNHSKFTGKCGTQRCTCCHLYPVCKSKNKTKGAQKHKNRLVMDRPDSILSGLSASMTLDHLSNHYMEEDEVENEEVDCDVNYSCNIEYGELVNQEDESKCIYSEVEIPCKKDQVEEEKDEDEDWYLVETCS